MPRMATTFGVIVVTALGWAATSPGDAPKPDSAAPPKSGSICSPAQLSAGAPTPITLAGWAKDAQLFQGLGQFHRKVSTESTEAQAYFDQGMRLLWAFNHDEATRSFARAAEIDPGCASCFWGVALTIGPNYGINILDSVREMR